MSDELDITDEPRSKNFKDRTGEKVGRLTIISVERVVKKVKYLKPNGKERSKVYWKCICECGEICVKSSDVLNNKKRGFSCGCLRNDKIIEYHSNKPKDHHNSALISMRARYKCDAEKRNISFDLDLQTFSNLVQSKCFYCDKESNNEIYYKNKDIRFKVNGIDRIDNNIGYKEDNCVACCKSCNTKKNGITPEMVIKLYKLMIDRGIINE